MVALTKAGARRYGPDYEVLAAMEGPSPVAPTGLGDLARQGGVALWDANALASGSALALSTHNVGVQIVLDRLHRVPRL